MSRFYSPPESVHNDTITITGDEVHHIIDVMRMAEGDSVVIFDGTGKEYRGFIREVKPRSKEVTVEVVKVTTPKPEKLPQITLVQAIPKKGKMEYIIEKATELGVYSIIPVITERTISRPDEKKQKKIIQRWQKIAKAAAKQCARTTVPVVAEITLLAKVVRRIDEYDMVLVACLDDSTVSIKKAISGFRTGNVLVFIGPEGGFTPQEISMVKCDSVKLVSLGRRVLKSETAGLFVLSVLGYEFGL